MNANKPLLTALGLAVAMAFSAPVLTASSASAAGYTAPATQPATAKPAPLVKKVSHKTKKPVHHKKHKKVAAPATAAPAKKTTM